MPEWTFVTNHAVVLSIINQHPRVPAREIAQVVGITERAVRKIIADLQAGGYITKKKEGRRVRYTVNQEMKLRHKTQRDKAVGNLLAVLEWKGD